MEYYTGSHDYATSISLSQIHSQIKEHKTHCLHSLHCKWKVILLTPFL